MRSFILCVLGLSITWMTSLVAKGDADGVIIHRWLGGGTSPKWTDKTNWHEQNNPSFFAFSSAISFDSEEGKRFGFGGEDFEFRAGTFLYPTNAGPFTVSAPILSIGGSVNENKDDGYILENIFSKGIIENHSSNTQTLEGKRLRIGWDTTIDTINGDVVLKGGADGSQFRINKHGPKSLTIADGVVDLKSLSFNQGDVTLSNVTGSILNENSFSTNYASSFSIVKGSQIKVCSTNKNDIFFIRHKFDVSGVNDAGEPSMVDFQNRPIALFSKGFKLDGGIFSNVGHIRLFNAWDGERYTFEFANGAEVSCKGMYVGVADRNLGQIGCSNVTLRLTGGTKDSPTTINLNNNDLLLGVRGGWGDLFSKGSNTIEVLGNSQIIGINKLQIPTDGSKHSKLILSDGAKLETRLLWFGFRGSCSTAVITGKDTRLNVTADDLTIGYTDWGNPTTNVTITVSNGAVLNSTPRMYVGQTSSAHKSENCPVSNVVVRVIKGGKLRSKGAVIGHASRTHNTSHAVDNKLIISGAGSAWESTGDTTIVGNAGSSTAQGNSIVVQDGARVLSKSQIIVGNGVGRPAVTNRFRLLSGSMMRQEQSIIVGKNNNSDNQSIRDNVFEMRGTSKAKTILKMDNQNIYIGYSQSNNRHAQDNRFILGPYSELTGVASIIIGAEKNCNNNTGNALVLAGGNALIENLTVNAKNLIELDLASAPKPLLVNKNVTFGEGACIKVVNAERAKPGQYPVLAWKGECKSIDNIKLDPSMDASRWVLDVRKDRKQIVLYYKN
ncbi:MAG: hypothetical protein J6V41_07505 [Kiritimatiellae bacterium]|nr:hypothetical protein [Kiritimatiellia bacterium]